MSLETEFAASVSNRDQHWRPKYIDLKQSLGPTWSQIETMLETKTFQSLTETKPFRSQLETKSFGL